MNSGSVEWFVYLGCYVPLLSWPVVAWQRHCWKLSAVRRPQLRFEWLTKRSVQRSCWRKLPARPQQQRRSAVYNIRTLICNIPHLKHVQFYTVSHEKRPPPSFLYFEQLGEENEPVLIIFGAQNPEEISHQKIINSLTSPECEIVKKKQKKIWSCLQDSWPHTDNTSTGSCQSHPLITGEDYYRTSVNWTLQICTGGKDKLYAAKKATLRFTR